MLHRHVVLLVLAFSSFRVSSSGHILYHHRRHHHRVSVVVRSYENGIGSLPRFYFCSFQKFLSVCFGVVELHLGFRSCGCALCCALVSVAREEEDPLRARKEKERITDRFLEELSASVIKSLA